MERMRERAREREEREEGRANTRTLLRKKSAMAIRLSLVVAMYIYVRVDVCIGLLSPNPGFKRENDVEVGASAQEDVAVHVGTRRLWILRKEHERGNPITRYTFIRLKLHTADTFYFADQE